MSDDDEHFITARDVEPMVSYYQSGFQAGLTAIDRAKGANDIKFVLYYNGTACPFVYYPTSAELWDLINSASDFGYRKGSDYLLEIVHQLETVFIEFEIKYGKMRGDLGKQQWELFFGQDASQTRLNWYRSIMELMDRGVVPNDISNGFRFINCTEDEGEGEVDDEPKIRKLSKSQIKNAKKRLKAKVKKAVTDVPPPLVSDGSSDEEDGGATPYPTLSPAFRWQITEIDAQDYLDAHAKKDDVELPEDHPPPLVRDGDEVEMEKNSVDTDSEITWFGTPRDNEPFFPSIEQCKLHIKRCQSSPEFGRMTKVYAGWESPIIGYYWYISHYDHENDVFYGFANLGDDDNSEWGIIDRGELERVYLHLHGTVRMAFPMLDTFSKGPVRAQDLPMSSIICRGFPMNQFCSGKHDCYKDGIIECAICHENWYCSEECQRAHKKKHARRCFPDVV
jgi:hypothetical protein